MKPRIVACELEAERAAQLAERLEAYSDSKLHGDAMHLRRRDGHAAALFLNPPYDTDPEHGRLEHRFLLRFGEHLAPGGALLLLVPQLALRASADYLATHFSDIRAWRLPEPHFDAYKQVLLVARREERLNISARFADTIRAWTTGSEPLPVLEETCTHPLDLVLSDDIDYAPRYVLEAVDVEGALARFRPFSSGATGTRLSVTELVGSPIETAMPPKPAHIAIALACGIFNGVELAPDDPGLHPPLLAKGVFARNLATVAEKHNAEGEHVGTVAIERPNLVLTILRLDTYAFHELTAGTVPTNKPDPADWNTADLIANYSESLTEILGRQFPALHDPTDPAAQLALPKLARTPYRAQAHVIRAALKVLATGRNPLLQAEVGTGKSTMALVIAAALSPEHRDDTVAELERLGFGTDRLPQVRRTLVLCPPHLITSWRNETAAVLPDASVQVLRTAQDLDQPADVYLLSREVAKLGYRVAGLEGTCPACGTRIPDAAKTNASRRRRCTAKVYRPRNLHARLAQDLAILLAPAAPNDYRVHSLVRFAACRLLGRDAVEPNTLNFQRRGVWIYDRLDQRCFDLYRRHVDPDDDSDVFTQLSKALDILCLLAGSLDELARLRTDLEALLDLGDDRYYGVATKVRETIGHIDAGRREPFGALGLDGMLDVLGKLYLETRWNIDRDPCDEPLFYAQPSPRRYPLAKLIQRRYPRMFDLVIVDEAQEFNHTASAQTKAAHRLMGLPGVTPLLLSGSLMGGYARALFANSWAANKDFRAEFARDQVGLFVSRYGYRKVFIGAGEGKKGPRSALGTVTDREIKTKLIGDAPGTHPAFLTRHLLPISATLHKSDLDVELPPLVETPAPVDIDHEREQDLELLAEYQRLESKVLTELKSSRFDPQRGGKLLGALVELPSYLDRATSDVGTFEIVYPTIGTEPAFVFARALSFPSSYRTPKERYLLSWIRERLTADDRVTVFLRHTGTPELPRRIERLIKTSVTSRVAWLDTKKVSTAKRERWIREQVVEAGVKVLLVNPNAVRTGLNCLTAFSAAIWHEYDYSAITYRQANGRFHRIGQQRPVTIAMPYQVGTAQETAFELIASKISASLQVDGLDLEAALEAAGASEAEASARAAAMSLGQAIYERLAGRRAA